MNLILALLVIFGGASYPVVQQDCPLCVSSSDGVFTEYAGARHDGSYGLLAHDYLAGKHLFALDVGDTVTIVLSNGEQSYRISNIWRARVAGSGFQTPFGKLSQAEMFGLAYGYPNRLTLQTCDGLDYRVFYVAEPITVRTRSDK